MADMGRPQNPTGGRDDLQIDMSRCLRTRFCESSCRRCAAACPQGAISLEGVLSTDAERCTGCLVCTTVCPSGALEHDGDFSTVLAQLSRVPEPVLGCIRTKESSHAALACLGGLSEEHLVTLCCSLPGKLTLNLTACGDCPNGATMPRLRQRADQLSGAGLMDGSGQIVMVESHHDLAFRDETVGRRSFFKSLRNSLFQSAALVLSSHNEQSEQHTAYAGKRLPARRVLLNRTRETASRALADRIGRHFDSCVSFKESCSSCQGCVAICPAGALQTEHHDTLPAFDRLLCTGCGLCREFCMDQALMISK